MFRTWYGKNNRYMIDKETWKIEYDMTKIIDTWKIKKLDK